MTVNARPAIVRLAVCELVLLLGATEYMTLPLPVPLAPDVKVSQLGGVEEFHAQPAGAFTVTLPAPPEEPKDAPLDEREKVQDGGALVVVPGAAVYVTSAENALSVVLL